LESIYEKALCIELIEQCVNFESQKVLPLKYKNQNIGNFRIDLVIEDSVIIEVKSVNRHDPIFESQILSYIKLGNYNLGLLINFNTKLLKQGIKIFII
jgi:GxxExxY protein